jgi:2-methylisocitrate lyase-like PEP mutase family enzyme
MTDFRDRALAQKTIWAAGAYDALSARIIGQSGFDAVMTSGFGVAASLLGQPDAELYTMSENVGVVRNVAAVAGVPVIADGDTGYGNALNVQRAVREFERAGAAAIIFEDQVSPKRCPISVAGVDVLPVEEAAQKIRAAVEARANPDTLIVARTDAANEDESIARAKAYVAAGADLIQPISRTFSSIDGLRRLRAEAGVPLSLQLLGWLERDLSREDIESVAGIATYPLVALLGTAAALRANLTALAAAKSTRDLPAERMDVKAFNAVIGFPDVIRLQERYLASPGNS